MSHQSSAATVIGNGPLGWKADDWLRAHKALAESSIPVEQELTFFIGADVCKHITAGTALPASFEAELGQMLQQFGGAPIAVRPSPVANFKTPRSFLCSSRNSDDVLSVMRALLHDSPTQTALMVMKVPGKQHGRCFYPHLSGVALSCNPYVWNEYIDPAAGAVKLVLGLGTWLINHTIDDFSRVVALNAPRRRPETDFDGIHHYSQRKMDFIDMGSGRLSSGYISDIVQGADDVPFHLFTSEGGSPHPVTGTSTLAVTFDPILSRTQFVGHLQDMLRAIEKSFECPVEIEFTANFTNDGQAAVSLVTCRPVRAPEKLRGSGRCLLKTSGAVLGRSRLLKLDHVVYINPAAYGQLPLQDRYEVARMIGRIVKNLDGQILLLGPGRWGTTSPELGIPVTFDDIHGVAAVGEIVAMRDNLAPEVSLGVHLLNELVATDMLYLAIFPGKEHTVFDAAFLEAAPNHLEELVQDAESWSHVIKVLDPETSIVLRADAEKRTTEAWIGE